MARNIFNGVPCRIANGPQTPEDVQDSIREMTDDEAELIRQLEWENSLTEEDHQAMTVKIKD